MEDLIPQEVIENRILMIRGQKVMIDRDLAELYDVETKHLNRQVKRNLLRFPQEFMFRLTKEEKEELVTNCHRFESLKHSTSLPFAFTEHGVAMLASVLKSNRAVKISIFIVKTFIRLRRYIFAHKELAEKFARLEKRVSAHDGEIKDIINAFRQLMEAEEKPKGKIGFRP